MYSVVAYDGQVYGPVDVATLVQWCRQGRIVADTQIVETQTGRTFSASQMPELHLVLTPAPATQYAGSSAYSPQAQAPFQQPYQQPYAGGFPSAQGYGMYPGAGVSQRSKMAALLLCFFLGGFGAHRFYLGHTVSGIAMLVVGLLSCAFNWIAVVAIVIWTTVDMIMLLSGSLKDAQGLPLR